MLKAKSGKHPKNEKQFIVQLIGQIDDQADIANEIGNLPDPPYELHVNCGQINRINSIGVKGWIKYFSKIAEARVPIYFYDCSPCIVQQMNLVFNFGCGGKVVSMQAPFTCETCEHSFVMTFTTGDIRKMNLDLPDQKCPKGDGMASFDDMPKVYFKFLTKPA